jgi:hypothetical protein
LSSWQPKTTSVPSVLASIMLGKVAAITHDFEVISD